jgi:hypothetical protein
MKTLIAIVSLVAVAAGCAPDLDSSHDGWRRADCWSAGCHSRDDTHKSDSAPSECVECHGRNGAPGGHGGKTPCGGCHDAQHGGTSRGFDDPESCNTCHP